MMSTRYYSGYIFGAVAVVSSTMFGIDISRSLLFAQEDERTDHAFFHLILCGADNLVPKVTSIALDDEERHRFI